MAEEKERELRRKHLEAVFKQILDLPDGEKGYMMGYLLICPWVSTTYKRYRPDGKMDTGAMIEWLNDRLLCFITDGKEGSKSIVSG